MKQIRPPACIERFKPSTQRVDPLPCGAGGCKATTLKQKPFCKKHMGRMPYAQRLMAQIRGRA